MAPTALLKVSFCAFKSPDELHQLRFGGEKNNLGFVLSDMCCYFVYDKMYSGYWNIKYLSCDLI